MVRQVSIFLQQKRKEIDKIASKEKWDSFKINAMLFKAFLEMNVGLGFGITGLDQWELKSYLDNQLSAPEVFESPEMLALPGGTQKFLRGFADKLCATLAEEN
jgi:hypothetical protein